MSLRPTDTYQPSVNPVDDLINEIKKDGFTDENIEALRNIGKNEEEEPEKNYFVAIDRKTLNALQYFGKLDENSKQLVHTQAPMSLLRTVGDSNNWKNGQYIGFGAKFVEEFLNKELDSIHKGVRLDSTSFATLVALAKLQQSGVAEQIKYIETDVNKKLKEINEMIARMTTLKAEAGEDGKTKMPDDIVKYFKDHKLDIPGSDHKLNAAEWDAAIRTMKTRADTISSQSQIETTKLQQRINKFSQSFELLTSLLDKFDKVSKKTAS
jgi:tRNA(Ser,Leu) C12 N-acetylase TAN1